MKPYMYLVIVKQWKYLLALCLVLIATLGIVKLSMTAVNAQFKMPIAIQDLDQSEASKQIVKSLSHTDFVEVKTLSEDDFDIESYILKKEAILTMTIPKGFSDKLADRKLKQALHVHSRDDFIGSIAFEVVSRTLYEAQIPYIIQAHLDNTTDIATIKDKYQTLTPESSITQKAYTGQSHTSISASVVFGLLLIVSSIQIVLHQRLKQNPALVRLYMYPWSKLKLYGTYIGIHTVLLMLFAIAVPLLMHQTLHWTYYVMTGVMIALFEWGVAALLFKVNTLSHRLFMTLIYAAAVTALYIIIQI